MDIFLEVDDEGFWVVVSGCLGVVELFGDEAVNKGIDEGFEKEGIFETGEVAGGFAVDAPHSEGEE